MEMRKMNMDKHVLEINLISAQGLKEPKASLRRMQTYAVAWVDQSTKLRTRIDRVGGDNPTWNDKFFFRVSSEFLCRETSGVSIAIYAVGVLRDKLIGNVRFLVSNFIPSGNAFKKTPSFIALQIQRPSGRFHGILNIGAMVVNGSSFAGSRSSLAAIGYRDVMKETLIRHQRRSRKSKAVIPENSVASSSPANSTPEHTPSSKVSIAESDYSPERSISESNSSHKISFADSSSSRRISFSGSSSSRKISFAESSLSQDESNQSPDHSLAKSSVENSIDEYDRSLKHAAESSSNHSSAKSERENSMAKSSGKNSFESIQVSYSGSPDSTTSSPLPTSSPLKDWDGVIDLAGKRHVRPSAGNGGLLCCFLMQKKIHTKVP